MAKIPTYKRKPQKPSETVKLSGASEVGQGLASLGQSFQEAGQMMHKYAQKEKKQRLRDEKSTYMAQLETTLGEVSADTMDKIDNKDWDKERAVEYFTEQLNKKNKKHLGETTYSKDAKNWIENYYKTESAKRISGIRRGGETVAGFLRKKKTKAKSRELRVAFTDYFTWEGETLSDASAKVMKKYKEGTIQEEDIEDDLRSLVQGKIDTHLEESDYPDEIKELLRSLWNREIGSYVDDIRMGGDTLPRAMYREAQEEKNKELALGIRGIKDWYGDLSDKLFPKYNKLLKEGEDPQRVAKKFDREFEARLKKHFENTEYSDKAKWRGKVYVRGLHAAQKTSIARGGESFGQTARDAKQRALKLATAKHKNFYKTTSGGLLKKLFEGLENGEIDEEAFPMMFNLEMDRMNAKYLKDANLSEDAEVEARVHHLMQKARVATAFDITVGELSGEVDRFFEEEESEKEATERARFRKFFDIDSGEVVTKIRTQLRNNEITPAQAMLDYDEEMTKRKEDFLDSAGFSDDTMKWVERYWMREHYKAVGDFGAGTEDIKRIVENHETLKNTVARNAHDTDIVDMADNLSKELVQEYEDGELLGSKIPAEFERRYKERSKKIREKTHLDPIANWGAKQYAEKYFVDAKKRFETSLEDIPALMKEIKEAKQLGIANNFKSGFNDKALAVMEYAFGTHEDNQGQVVLNVPLGERKEYVKEQLETYSENADLSGLSDRRLKELRGWAERRTSDEKRSAFTKDQKLELEGSIVSQQKVVQTARERLAAAKRSGNTSAIIEWTANLRKATETLTGLSGKKTTENTLKKGYIADIEDSITGAHRISAVMEAWGRVKYNLLDPSERTAIKRLAKKQISQIRTDTVKQIRDALIAHSKGEDITKFIPRLKKLAVENLGKPEAFPISLGLDSLYSKYEKITPLTQKEQDAATDKANALTGEYLAGNDPEEQMEVLAELTKSLAINESEKVFLIEKMLDDTDTNQGWPNKGDKDKNGFNYLRELYLAMARDAGTTEVYGDFFETWERLEAIQDDGYENFLPEDEDFQRLSSREKAVYVIDELVKAKRNKIVKNNIFENRLAIFGDAYPLPTAESTKGLFFPGRVRDDEYDPTESATVGGGTKGSDKEKSLDRFFEWERPEAEDTEETPSPESDEEKSFFGIGRFGPLDIRDIPDKTKELRQNALDMFTEEEDE